MENKEPDLDVQPEDWERQPSETADLEQNYRVDRARVDERIKAIQDRLIRHDERMTRIETGIGTVKNDLEKGTDTVKGDLEKDVDTVKKDLNDRISRLETRLQWRVTLIFAGVSIFVSILVLRQVPNDGYKSLDHGSPDDVFPVGASCARDLFTYQL